MAVFFDYCLSVCLCLQMKMPVTIGQKKAKLIEQLLDEMGVGMW